MILKLQQGGAAAPPLVSYQPIMLSNSNETMGNTDTTKTSETTDLTDKDLLKMLEKLDGLPSDMTVLTNTLQNFYIDQQYSPFPNTANIASRYLQTLFQMKKANFNMEEYKNAFNTVSKNGGINELAINDRGQLFCMNNEGDFELFTVQQLKSNPNYQALTNSDLLDLRAHSPQLANNNEILKVVKNGIGIETVTKMIQDNISDLGTSTESSEGYAKMKSQQLITGLQDFINAQEQSGNYDATVDNLYKGKLLTKSQAMQSQQALAYIYRTLPENAKTLLKTKTQNGTDSEAIELVSTLVNSKLNYSREFSLDLDKEAKNSSDKNSKDPNDKIEADLVMQIQAGNGGHDTVYTVDNKMGIGMTIAGTAYEQVKDTQGNHIGKTSVENLLNSSGLRSIINADNGIYFGDQKIDLDNLSNISYDGKGLLRANLPIREDGSPNFDLLDEYSKAQSEFLLSSQTQEDRLKIFGNKEKYPNLSSLITPNGDFDKSKFAPFIVVSGITTDNLMEIDKKNNTFITEVKQTPELVQELKNSLAVGSGKNIQYPGIDEYDWSEWLIPEFINGYDHLFKGNIFIPLNMNKSAAALGGNQNLNINSAQSLEQEYQQRDINFQKLNPSILNN